MANSEIAPVYTQRDLEQHEKAAELLSELIGQRVSSNVTRVFKKELTHDRVIEESALLGIISGTFSYELFRVRQYLADQREEVQP